MIEQQIDFVADVIAPEKCIRRQRLVEAVLEPLAHQQRLEQRAARGVRLQSPRVADIEEVGRKPGPASDWVMLAISPNCSEPVSTNCPAVRCSSTRVCRYTRG